jgi:Transposase, Mutator family
MPQAATIKSLPVAFAMVKAMRAEGVEWGEGCRAGARHALAELLEGRMDQLIDQHLERMAELGQADRRNGCYRRWVDRARRHRAGGAAHPDLQRAPGGPRLRPAGEGRRPHDPGVLGARALDPQGGDRAPARPRPAGQPGPSECRRQAARCRRGGVPPPAAQGHLPRPGPGRCGAQAQDRRRRAGPAGAGRAWPAAGRKKEIIDFRLASAESAAQWEEFLGDLVGRGLTGQCLEMLCVDGGTGLLAALPTAYPEVPVQRCWAAQDPQRAQPGPQARPSGPQGQPAPDHERPDAAPGTLRRPPLRRPLEGHLSQGRGLSARRPRRPAHLRALSRPCAA